MTPQMRNFYQLEKRWKDAEEVDISLIISEDEMNFNNRMTTSTIQTENEEYKEESDDDPFWQ